MYVRDSTPTISVNPTSLSGFTYVEGSGPSEEQTFTISGSNLTANISIAASTNYEISETSGSGYTTPITLTQTDGSVGETTIYVRLKAGLSVGDYNSEDITATSTDATDRTVTCSGSVTPLATIAVDPATLTGFTYVFGSGPSTSQNYDLSGTNLTPASGNLTVTGSTNYEVSTNNSAFGPSVNVPNSSSTLASATIYVRLKAGLSVGNYDSEIITNSGGGAITENVTVSGSVTAPVSSLPMAENFDYGGVDDTSLVTLTSNWVRHSGSMGPAYSSTSLSYTDYPSSGVGGAVTFLNGGSGVNDGDINRVFNAVTLTSNIYVSFLLNISSALSADYFLHLSTNPFSTSYFRGRVFARSNGAGWSFGLSKSSDTRTDDNTILNFDQTYLIVLKYSFNTTATDDDLVTLYVYSSGVPSSEPGTPLVTIGPVGAGTISDPTNIGSVVIRQGSNTPTGKIDGIRVATSWSEAPLPVELFGNRFLIFGFDSAVKLHWRTGNGG